MLDEEKDNGTRMDSGRGCGAWYFGSNRCAFTVWAPLKEKVELHLLDPEEIMPMAKDEEGYFSVTCNGIKPGRRYFYTVEGEDFPDPASFHQPQSVHGPSAVVDHHSYKWNDQGWKGIPFQDLVLYELHVGTFTGEGTFEAIIPRLDDLVELGVNGIEIMPVSQFAGNRNWGYDGVYPYSVQNTYGGPDGLKKLIDACHQKGIAVILDVVYNHLGPEGNYFSNYGPYFTNKYCTPWGDAINFDGEWSDGVREYYCNNALYWFEYFRIDGLRLDAVHMVFDNGAIPFWQLVNERVRRLQEKVGRPLHMIAESDLNSPKVVTDAAIGGFGFKAQWLDDFHHALYVLLDSKGRERYADFGQMEIAAAAVLLSPYVPMLFMGEEYGDRSPFYYFVSHSDQDLIEAVRKGRREEFKDFKTGGEAPDPQDEKTFSDSILAWHLRKEVPHGMLFRWYKELIALRKRHPVLQNFNKNDIRIQLIDQSAFVVCRKLAGCLICVFNFSEHHLKFHIAFAADKWIKVLDSNAEQWNKAGKKGEVMVDAITGNEPIVLLPLTVAVYEAR